jgi:hypothetical protein
VYSFFIIRKNFDKKRIKIKMLRNFLYFSTILVVFGFTHKNQNLWAEKVLAQVVTELYDNRNVTDLEIIDFGNHSKKELIKIVFETHKGTL